MATSLEINITSIRNELSETIDDKSRYLAECAKDRIQHCSQSFDEKLDHYLSLLERSEVNSRDLTRMGNSLKSISKLVNKSCSEFIHILRKYDKNLFK